MAAPVRVRHRFAALKLRQRSHGDKPDSCDALEPAFDDPLADGDATARSPKLR